MDGLNALINARPARVLNKFPEENPMLRQFSTIALLPFLFAGCGPVPKGRIICPAAPAE